MRKDNRKPTELRPIKITANPVIHPAGSAMIEFGNTRVLCTASIENKLPRWLQGEGRGWVTAEYGMLPGSTNDRIRRDKAMSGGRTQEISRLIGRSLRATTNLEALGEQSIIIDCDVLQADGGTRTASITGGYVALALALNKLKTEGKISTIPLNDYVSAISVGASGDDVLLDLNYDEDSTTETDMNFVMTGNGNFVEIQGTAEGAPFSKLHLDQMAEVAHKGCVELFKYQEQIIGEFFPLSKGN